MKWTRHRCHEAPTNCCATADLRPAWASEMTRCTPLRPRALSERRKSDQNSNDSLSPTAVPNTSRVPSIETPVATTRAWESTCAPMRTLQKVASVNT